MNVKSIESFNHSNSLDEKKLQSFINIFVNILSYVISTGDERVKEKNL